MQPRARAGTLTWTIFERFALGCALAVSLSLAGCQAEPRPVQLGVDSCTFCRMTVGDPRFAAEFVTKKGKVLTFDSIECLAAFAVADEDAGTPWVTNFNDPGEWLKADRAFFVRSPAVRSPMGLNVSAYKTRAAFEKAKSDSNGQELRWDDVLLLVRATGFAKDPAGHPHVPKGP